MDGALILSYLIYLISDNKIRLYLFYLIYLYLSGGTGQVASLPVSYFPPRAPAQRDCTAEDMLSLFAAAASFNAPTTMVGQSAVMMRTEVARTVPQMAMPSLKDAKGLSDEDIAKEILTAQKARCP